MLLLLQVFAIESVLVVVAAVVAVEACGGYYVAVTMVLFVVDDLHHITIPFAVTGIVNSSSTTTRHCQPRQP